MPKRAPEVAVLRVRVPSAASKAMLRLCAVGLVALASLSSACLQAQAPASASDAAATRIALMRDDYRAFFDVHVSSDYLVQIAYRDLDYVEDAYDAYDAGILKVAFGVSW
jgi:hypothetical protein